MSRRRHHASNEPLLDLEGHGRPVTRRDFLGRGLISGAAMIASPSLFGLFGSRNDAWAQAVAECGLSGGGGRIPFVCFDLGGGASVSGSNVLVGGPLGQLDPLTDDGYTRLGLPADMLPSLPGQVNTELGLAFHSDSAFLRGILDKTAPETRANVNGCIICARSDNDTGNNPHNPMYGINKAGASGNLVTLIGTEPSESGGRSLAPMSMIDPQVRPVKIDRPSDATGLVDTGKLVQLLNQEDAAAVMAATEQITELKLDHMTEEDVVEQLIRCSFVQSTDLVATFGDPQLLNPLNDILITGDDATSIFSAAEVDQSKFEKTSTVMKLVVNGYAGAGTIQFGGYDYHDGTRATGEIRDFEAGQAMGAVLEYAARLGQQVVVYVFSDGSVGSDGEIDNSAAGRGKPVWRGDNSGTAAVFMLVYDPAGPPQLTDPSRQQIGYFRPGGSVETASSPVANNVVQLAQSIVLNYLALHGEVGRLDEVLPGHGLGAGATRDALVAFQPIRTMGT
ncbi:MAG: general secretion pathway protein GspF [Myxococcota bacterium]|nr:general secretion pathway protein GspF [Myxococcota bacterium]